MPEIDIELLKKPFKPEEIKQREGAGKKMFSYVDHESVLSRVMEACGDKFSWEIMECGYHAPEKYMKKDWDTKQMVEAVRGGFFWCRGRLTIEGLGTREGYGTQQWENEDSPKAAETDSFKRSAMRFGVALQLYEKPDASQKVTGSGGQTSVGTSGSPAGKKVNTGAGQCSVCNAPSTKPCCNPAKCPLG